MRAHPSFRGTNFSVMDLFLKLRCDVLMQKTTKQKTLKSLIITGRLKSTSASERKISHNCQRSLCLIWNSLTYAGNESLTAAHQALWRMSIKHHGPECRLTMKPFRAHQKGSNSDLIYAFFCALLLARLVSASQIVGSLSWGKKKVFSLVKNNWWNIIKSHVCISVYFSELISYSVCRNANYQSSPCYYFPPPYSFLLNIKGPWLEWTAPQVNKQHREVKWHVGSLWACFVTFWNLAFLSWFFNLRQIWRHFILSDVYKKQPFDKGICVRAVGGLFFTSILPSVAWCLRISSFFPLIWKLLYQTPFKNP